jgi:hypothetical protein
LLRNLLDAIKTEELKRRQTALLEVLRPTKPNTLDDLLKMKIKSNFIIFIITSIDVSSFNYRQSLSHPTHLLFSLTKSIL